MDELYKLKLSPICKKENTVQGDYYRFTILTPNLIRMEYDEEGIFENRATQSVINRDFEIQSFQIIDKDEGLEIITDAVHIFYDKKPFSRNGLVVKMRGNYSNYRSVWNYSDITNDLLGTTRTLDAVDGPTKLDHGLVSKNGFSVYDDSSSLIIREDGWIEPRRENIEDIYFFGYGRNYRQCIKDFYRLSGETPLLPKYALGNWWSRYFKYTEQSYKALIERFEEEKIPFTVSVIDMDWHLVDIDPKYGSGWTGYTWNEELFPDPEAFMKWLHEKGYRITLNVHPADGIRAHEEMYEEMAEALGINYNSEAPITFDVTNIEFLKAYFKFAHYPNEKNGVDFWWIDWQQGEQSKIKGLDPLWMLNHLHYLDNQKSGNRGMILSRYAGIGSHRYPVGFSGDTVISWKSLDFQPYFTANASNVGYSWWSHDIGGHMRGSRDDELATRWVQFGVFSPIMRLHSTSNQFQGKEPWRYNLIAHQVMNKFLRLRHQLIPYLYTMNYRNYSNGEPLVQPMYYAYPNHEESYTVNNQYLFGTELIVAPITGPMDKSIQCSNVKAWLPKGIYIDFFNGMIYRGDRLLELHRGIESIPVLAKAGGIVPLNAEDYNQNNLDNPVDLEVRIFAGADGDFSLYEDDGESLDYINGEYVITKMTLDWSSKGQFIIHASQGNNGLIPSRRNYNLRFIGFEDLADIEVKCDNIPVEFTKVYNSKSNTIELSIDQVKTTSDLCVDFGCKPQLARNNVDEYLFDFLDKTQIEYDLKAKVYQIIKNNMNIAKIISSLPSMHISENLFSALCEIILSDV